MAAVADPVPSNQDATTTEARPRPQDSPSESETCRAGEPSAAEAPSSRPLKKRRLYKDDESDDDENDDDDDKAATPNAGDAHAAPEDSHGALEDLEEVRPARQHLRAAHVSDDECDSVSAPAAPVRRRRRASSSCSSSSRGGFGFDASSSLAATAAAQGAAVPSGIFCDGEELTSASPAASHPLAVYLAGEMVDFRTGPVPPPAPLRPLGPHPSLPARDGEGGGGGPPMPLSAPDFSPMFGPVAPNPSRVGAGWGDKDKTDRLVAYLAKRRRRVTGSPVLLPNRPKKRSNPYISQEIPPVVPLVVSSSVCNSPLPLRQTSMVGGAPTPPPFARGPLVSPRLASLPGTPILMPSLSLGEAAVSQAVIDSLPPLALGCAAAPETLASDAAAAAPAFAPDAAAPEPQRRAAERADLASASHPAPSAVEADPCTSDVMDAALALASIVPAAGRA